MFKIKSDNTEDKISYVGLADSKDGSGINLFIENSDGVKFHVLRLTHDGDIIIFKNNESCEELKTDSSGRAIISFRD